MSKTKEEIKGNNEELEAQIGMIINADNPVTTFEDEPEGNVPSLEYIVGEYDYDKKTKKSINKARQLLVSLLDFYLDQDFINNNEYVLHKTKIDEMGLSQIIKQVEHNDRMIEILMKMVDSGELNVRVFDTFTQLQRTHLELMKMQTMYIVNMEETVKKLRNDHEYIKTLEITHEEQPDSVKMLTIGDSNPQVYRGTKELMQQLEAEEVKTD